MPKHDVFMKVPVTHGRTGINPRNTKEGWMIDEDASARSMPALRAVMAEEARAKGVDPTPSWLTKSVAGLLALYGEAYKQWQACRQDTVGHVFEAALPSGKVILFGDSRILARLAS